jgi:hypothetical protein
MTQRYCPAWLTAPRPGSLWSRIRPWWRRLSRRRHALTPDERHTGLYTLVGPQIWGLGKPFNDGMHRRQK